MSPVCRFGNPASPSVIPVVPTPFDTNEQVDTGALAALIRFSASAGVQAVCLPAYASEFYKLSDSERALVVETAVRAAAGRVPVIAQANHGSARVAAETARRYEAAGADGIALALPRQFALSERDLLRYAVRVATAVQLPIVIQDFNPGSTTVGADFARRLKEAAPNFEYLKLEDPMMGARVGAIREATADAVGVLEGWGGMYVLELSPAGIAGIMPGLGLSDRLRCVLNHAIAGRTSEARESFQRLLPFIVYSLQNLELFHHAEKRLLNARGLLPCPTIREPRLELGPIETSYLGALIAGLTADAT